MASPAWTDKVFRLRRLPHYVTDVVEAASLISTALGIPLDDTVIRSLATTSNQWESPPSKIVTLQLNSIPGWLQDESRKRQEWEISFAEAPGGKLILDAHFEGLTVLNDVDRELHHTDCIAISGLSSHPFGSWQPHGYDKSFMWIRDEVPRSIPGIRMILYGYNSRLVESQSFQSINDIALGLIHQLDTGGWNLSTSKPIIFLAHSLGGIVLKDAIVQIADREIVASMLDRVRGAIMFGVPNLGMYQTHLIAMTHGRSNEILVQDLSQENGNAYLRHLNTRFDGLSFIKKSQIYWAYETKESTIAAKQADGSWARNGPPQLLVNPDSATCHYNSKNKAMTVPIDKDHSSLVKFSSGDKDLNTIISILSNICAQEHLGSYLAWADESQAYDDARQENRLLLKFDVISVERKEALKSLSQILNSINDIRKSLDSKELYCRMKEIESPFQETFKWIFEMSLFCKWLQEGSGLFWINGKPGSGKSTLMKCIYSSTLTWELLHDWRRSTHKVREITAGFFFHYRGTPLQKSFEGILRSVLLQILDPYFDSFQKRWEKLPSLQEKERKATMDIETLTEESQNQEKSFASESFKKLIRKKEAEIISYRKEMAKLATDFISASTAPETIFISKVVSNYYHCTEGRIDRLEKTLSLLLDQDLIKMDIVLFFDALDEFDGHIDMISRFLKSLVRVSTSGTRLKLCFSSRPWKALQGHFSTYPSISLQEYTRNDIELYAASKITNLSWNGPSALSLVPLIVTRSRGVFLWVKLAVREVLAAASKASRNLSLNDLEQILLQLPGDLHSFYELIIERITQTNRRQTYALLELIIRQQSPLSVESLWLAVRISGCSTFNDALPYFHYRMESLRTPKYQEADISAWGGGLVEINCGSPQLMHQTVLEFATGLSFKKLVLGALAPIVVENGHSFCFKYLITAAVYEHPSTQGSRDMSQPSSQLAHEKEIVYHAEQSELTTGHSQLNFIESIPRKELQNYNNLPSDVNREASADVLSFASKSGLALCMRDWIENNVEGLRHVCCDTIWPLLRLVIFCPKAGKFNSRYIEMVRLLLENGFELKQDPGFFNILIAQVWVKWTGMTEHDKGVPMPALHELVALALDHGQDPNIAANVPSDDEDRCVTASPIHLVPPTLAEKLIQFGADPNTHDSSNKTPLDWVLTSTYSPTVVETPMSLYEWRHQMIEILIKAGAEISPQQHITLARWLKEFEKRGLDTITLRDALGVEYINTLEIKVNNLPIYRKLRYKLIKFFKSS